MTGLADYARRKHKLSGLDEADWLFPYCAPLESVRAGEVVSFAHYDYLALAHDTSIRAAAAAAAVDIGVGAGASRFVGGELSIHRALEHDLADFVGVEDCLALVSGYTTNVALVGHILAKGDLLLVDGSAHNSIFVGSQVSRAETMAFRHNDLDHLRALLERHRKSHKRALLVVEGLYSMDGDIPDLPRLIALCRDFNCWLMIDEAHSIGVLGDTGRGITEHFGIPARDIDLIIGTLSKAFVSCGGFIGGSKTVIDWLRHTLPGFVYSVGMPPPTAAAARQALSILQSQPERVANLKAICRYFIEAARSRNLDFGTAVGAGIVPIMFHSVGDALRAGHAALAAGFYVPPIAQIAVPKDAPRMRFFLTAAHTTDQIDRVLDAVSMSIDPSLTLRSCRSQAISFDAELTAVQNPNLSV